MFLSILIPTFNRPDYLLRLLNSFKCSNLDLVEIIVGDNSEDDLTEKVCLDFKKSLGCNFTYYHHQKNLGFDGNVFFLAAKSNARYSWFVGDDDVFLKGAIDVVLQSLLKFQPDLSFANFTFNHSYLINRSSIEINQTTLKKYIIENGPKFLFLSINIIKTELNKNALNKINLEDSSHREIGHAALVLSMKPNSTVITYDQSLIVNAGAERHHQSGSITSKSFDLYTRIIFSLVNLWKKSPIRKSFLASFMYYSYTFIHSFRRIYAISRVYDLSLREIIITFKIGFFTFIPTLLVILIPKPLNKLFYKIYIKSRLKKLFWKFNS